MIAELNQNIMEYESIVEGIREQSAKEGSEKEEQFAKELSLLTEEKSELETQITEFQNLLSDKEKSYMILLQQKEELEKNMAEKDKTIENLSENINTYDEQIQIIIEKMAKEGSEKEQQFAKELSLLTEEKNRVEIQLAEAIDKSQPDYYEVRRGDSLWRIAEKFYDKGEKWRRIFEANKDIISNPSTIYPYQRFTIPKE